MTTQCCEGVRIFWRASSESLNDSLYLICDNILDCFHNLEVVRVLRVLGLKSKKDYIDDVTARSRDQLEMNLSIFLESPKDYLQYLWLKSHLSLLLLSHLHDKVVMVLR